MRELGAQFVPVKIDTGGSEDWKKWSAKYKHDGSGIPIVYVVRADGKQLYGKSGTPDPLKEFLALALRQAGAILSDRQLRKMAQSVAQAKIFTEQGEIPRAVSIVNRSAGSGSFAETALALDQLANELIEEGETRFDEAVKKVESRDSAFEGALALVEVRRLYGKLPGLKKTVGSQIASLRKDPNTKDVIQQAQFVDKARQYEARNRWKLALSAYRSVLVKFPDSPAAKFALAATETIEKKSGAKATRPSTTTKSAGGPSADEKRAASRVRLGKLLLKKSPAKARPYLEEAIRLAPDSLAAKEAKELLEKIDR